MWWCARYGPLCADPLWAGASWSVTARCGRGPNPLFRNQKGAIVVRVMKAIVGGDHGAQLSSHPVQVVQLKGGEVAGGGELRQRRGGAGARLYLLADVEKNPPGRPSPPQAK